MQNITFKFEANKSYHASFIGDADLKPAFTCKSRTDNTAVFEDVRTGETLKRKIKIHSDSEFVLFGSYSMSPTIAASRLIK